jgi:starch synthase
MSSTPAMLEEYEDLDDEHLNVMKLGILTADLVTTVSTTYAKEILTPEYGAGLESFLSRRKKHLSGIINGIDTKLFNPATDKLIAKKYSLKNWKQSKAANKRALQKSLKLPQGTVPIYGLVSRLVTQKGLDILAQSLELFLKQDIQVIILGTGEKQLELKLLELAKRFPKKLHITIGFDLKQAQQIYAGSDFFLMPSRFEPCGLGQLIAMRYGTIPLVRATGGLKDTVHHMKTGIVFTEYSNIALSKALMQSYALYSDSKKYSVMVQRDIRQDFSWNSSAKKYLQLYSKLLS